MLRTSKPGSRTARRVEWALTLTDAAAPPPSWLGDAFIELEAEMEGEHMWHFVFGRSDANGQLVALYHDPRPTSRLFHMTLRRR